MSGDEALDPLDVRTELAQHLVRLLCGATDQVLSFYRKRGLEPKVGFEVRELQTALGLVAAGLGISFVPLSVRRLGREDVDYLPLEEPDIAERPRIPTVGDAATPEPSVASNMTALAMAFKSVEGAQLSWRRLDGHAQLLKLILGVKFSDGLEVRQGDEAMPMRS